MARNGTQVTEGSARLIYAGHKGITVYRRISRTDGSRYWARVAWFDLVGELDRYIGGTANAGTAELAANAADLRAALETVYEIRAAQRARLGLVS